MMFRKLFGHRRNPTHDDHRNERVFDCSKLNSINAVGNYIDDHTIAGDSASMPDRLIINLEVARTIVGVTDAYYRNHKPRPLLFRTIPCEVVDV